MSRPAIFLLIVALLAPGLAAAHTTQEHRSVTVSGEGEVSVKPDRARLSMSVDNLAADVKSAEAEVNRVTRAYLAQAKSLGVKDEQISTAGMTLSPEYVWDEKAKKQTLAGYRASRQITVTVEPLDQLGDLIIAATNAGVNQISPPVLESSKARELSRQALAKAADDARAKAQLLADTLGVKLGTVRSITASDSSAAPPPRPMMFKAMAMQASPASDSGNDQMGLAAGEIKYNASVNAEFDLVAP